MSTNTEHSWRLQIRRTPVERVTHSGIIRPAVMPEVSFLDWTFYAMPRRDAEISDEEAAIFAKDWPSKIHRIGDMFVDSDEPMSLEDAMDRWQDFPKWNTSQFDFRLIDVETGEVIPLFLL